VNPQELLEKQVRKSRPSLDLDCALCPNPKDRKTLCIPSAGGVGLPIRIVALGSEVSTIDGPARAPRLLRGKAGGLSLQELIVETPDHSLHTALLPETHLAHVLGALKARYEELSRDPRIAHVTIAKKHGGEAAFEHSHWQLEATDAIPAQVSGWLQHARRHYGKYGNCLFCVALQEELETQSRIVLVNDHFAALEPYASPSPFCTHIYPRRHMASFTEINTGEIQDLAHVLRDVLVRFYHGLEDPDFLCTLRTAPLGNAAVKYYHWSFSIVPCFTPVAAPGREVCVNSVLPETAAEFLRAVRVEQAISA